MTVSLASSDSRLNYSCNKIMTAIVGALRGVSVELFYCCQWVMMVQI